MKLQVPALAELELERQRHSVVRRVEMRKGLRHLADVLREAGITLQRNFGREAYLILEEAFDDYVRQIKDIFRSEEETGREETRPDP